RRAFSFFCIRAMVGAIFPGAERLVYATLPRGVYLVVGPPGVGKTCFIYTSLAHWLKRKFPGIILVTDVSPRVVFEDFNRIGVSKEVSEDLLRIVDCYSAKAGKSSETKYVVKSPDNPTEINILLSESLSGVKEPMVCIDSMNSLVSPFEDKPQLARGLVERIVANLRENGSYSLVTMTSGVSEERLTRFVESIVDGVIEMRMVESNTEELRRH
ncbi:MAG: RAD55 family ATPase, partial [Candidatus Bathyarchaeia archaeon]